ncbi:MAG TPA: hypothetical protein VGM13_06010 [Thermoanaerobaculia bacterium]|jgi:hypothetical protein
MKRGLSLLAICLTICVHIAAGPTEDKQQAPAGAILEIEGTVLLRTSLGAPAIRLDPKRDLMRSLYLGQALRVEPGGHVKAAFMSGVRELGPSEEWFTLALVTPRTTQQKRVAEALREYGRPGGSRSGSVGTLVSPGNGTVILAEKSTVRWRSGSFTGTLSFRLESSSGKVLWKEDGINPNTESLDSATLRETLSRWRDSEAAGPLVLTVTGTSGGTAEAAFSVLSKREESKLEADLRAWQIVGDALLEKIGRAYECRQRGLRTEEIEELEAALQIAPESTEVLSLLSEAHRRYGDSARAETLRNKAELVR